MKILFLILMATSSLTYAKGFLRHVMIIGTGIAVGHAASKAIDYGSKQYQNHNSDHNNSTNHKQ